jgi:hypothetical protein
MIVKRITVKPRADNTELGYLKVPKPRQRRGRVYFAPDPVEVTQTSYITRRLLRGDLVEVKPDAKPKKKEG